MIGLPLLAERLYNKGRVLTEGAMVYTTIAGYHHYCVGVPLAAGLSKTTEVSNAREIGMIKFFTFRYRFKKNIGCVVATSVPQEKDAVTNWLAMVAIAAPSAAIVVLVRDMKEAGPLYASAAMLTNVNVKLLAVVPYVGKVLAIFYRGLSVNLIVN
jgi:hypothetical protein